eukprot:74579_1
MIMPFFGLQCKSIPWTHGIITADRLAKIASTSHPSNTIIFPYTPIDYNALKAQNTTIPNVHFNTITIRTLSIKCNCCTLNNSGRCNYCDKIEDVFHYMFNCNKYNKERKRLIFTLIPIYVQYNTTISLKTLLFPPKPLTWAHRKLILQSISIYVINTGRFKG